MYYEAAMIGLNLIKMHNSDKLNSEQNKIFKLQKEDLENQKRYLDETAKINIDNVNEAFSENYGNFVAESSKIKETIRNKAEEENEAYLKVAGKRRGIESSSFNMDAQNLINAKTEDATREINTSLIKQGDVLTKQMTQSMTNINATRMQTTLGLESQGLQISMSESMAEIDRINQSVGSIMNIGQIGAGVYGDYKKTGGSGGFMDWAKKQF